MNYPPNIKEIEKFANETRIDVKYLLGEELKGDLFLLETVQVLPANIVFNITGDLFLWNVRNIHSSVQFVNYKRLFLPFYKKVKVIWT